MEATFPPGALLSQLVEALRDTVSDVSLRCDEHGLALNAMDSSHIALVVLDLPAASFAKFACPAPMVISLSVTMLSKITKSASFSSKTGVVRLAAAKDGDRLLIQVFQSETAKAPEAEFELKLMDLDDEDLNIPAHEHQAQVRMMSDDLAGLLGDLKNIGDMCAVAVQQDLISLGTDGDIGSARFTRRPNEEPKTACSIRATAPVRLAFATKVLLQFTKARTFSKEVVVRVSEAFPLQLDFQVGALEAKGLLSFFLAPKLEDDAEAEVKRQRAAEEEEE